jgi:hypothetical protein
VRYLGESAKRICRLDRTSFLVEAQGGGYSIAMMRRRGSKQTTTTLREHRIVDRIKDVAIRSFRSVAQFVKEHRLLERGTQAVGRAAYWAANKIADKVRSHQQPHHQGSGGGSSTTAQYRAVRGRDTLDDNSKNSLEK